MRGFPVIIPPPGSLDAGGLAVSRIAKCVITADTTLSSDDFDLMWNDSDADSDLDVPIFVFPEGIMVEDFGTQTIAVWTESAAFTFGDCDDSDGWGSTLSFVATDVDGANVIRWASKYMVNTELESTVKVNDTAIVPAYLAWGPIVMWSSSADTGQDTTIVGLDTDVLDIGFGTALHYIAAHSKGAQAIKGTTNVYLKYNYAHYLKPNPSTDLGTRD